MYTMKKFITVTVLTLTFAALVAAQQRDEWIKYSSAEGRYTVSLPAQPRTSTQEAASADNQKLTQYLASVVEPGDIVFLVGYFDSLPGTIFSVDAAREGVLRQSKGTLVSDTTISLAGYPGKEIKVLTTPAQAGAKAGEAVEYLAQVRFYEVDKRVYVVQFIAPKSLQSDGLSAKAARFFDSFQVVKN